jgi:hypothetical protein
MPAWHARIGVRSRRRGSTRSSSTRMSLGDVGRWLHLRPTRDDTFGVKTDG